MVSNIVTQLNNIFKAKSIAIIGASSREGSFGRLFLEGMVNIGFEKLYPVHPREAEIIGIKAYPSVTDIPYDVELAVLLTPVTHTLGVAQECVQKGVKGMIVFTAGFGEKDQEGKEIEKKIASMAREAGIRVVGPNSIGIYSPEAKINTFPQALVDKVPAEKGTIGAFSHSGSFVDYLTTMLCTKGLRFTQAVSCGNECDLSAVDFLEYLGQDGDTKVIVSYLEGIKNGRKFYELAKNISKEKPIIVWKGGKTESGARAAMAHTGSLAGSKVIWDSMFKQTGIINVSSFEEILECAIGFGCLSLPKGNRVAIVAGQGGTGVGTSDNCTLMGLDVARFSKETVEKLKSILPPAGTNAGNPADVGVAVLIAPHLYGEAIKVIAEDDNIDMFLIISPPNRACSESIVAAAKEIDKPLVVSLYALPELATAEYQYYAENRIPVYSDAQKAAFVLSKLNEYARYRAK